MTALHFIVLYFICYRSLRAVVVKLLAFTSHINRELGVVGWIPGFSSPSDETLNRDPHLRMT